MPWRCSGEQGGWPLTMFLSPDGEPFWGGTYFPPEPRWGRPGFAQVLQGVAQTFRSDPDKVRKNIVALREALQRLGRPEAGEGIDPALFDRIAERLLREVDPLNGGIGTAPKFPQCGIFELLWRGWKRTRQGPFRDAVLRTLTTICQGGIYDHLGGGFARYSVDARWLAPHFEKMLYDNAELVDLLTLVWQEVRDPLYAQRVAETIGWLQREMLTGEGGFCSSLDADSEHEEGKFYVWTAAEIDAALGDDAAVFKEFYDVTAEGNWEGHTILNRLAHPEMADAETESLLARCREKLFVARAPRVRPGLDDKVLADWNGLMIAALAHAGLVFERPDWVALAERAFAFVRQQMAAPEGRLFHSWREGRARHPATRRRLRQSLPGRTGAARSDTGCGLSRSGAPVDRGARPALLGRSRRRLFLCCGRYRGTDRASQNRQRRRGAGGQRHAGRGADPAGDPDRRGRLSRARRGHRQGVRRRGLTPIFSRSRP